MSPVSARTGIVPGGTGAIQSADPERARGRRRGYHGRMRDIPAALVAILLILFALRLATTLTRDRRRRNDERAAIAAGGRKILAEIPSDEGLLFFTEDAAAFHLGDRPIPKAAITAARVLVNGAPIAVAARPGHDAAAAISSDLVRQRPEGLARDQWDVAIDTGQSTVVVPCGAIREQVSQELARGIFDAVKRVLR